MSGTMKNPFRNIPAKIREINNFIWNTRLAETSGRKGFLVRYLRTLVLAARGFTQDKVQLRASSLTFYTLLSLIPMAAIAFGIAKGFGLDAELERQLISAFAGSGDVLDWVLELKDNTLQGTRGGYMAGIGIVILFWSVVQLLSHIENSFNGIWQVRQSRPLIRKFADYIAIMLIAPVFVILSSSVTIFINTSLTEYMAEASVPSTVRGTITSLVKFSPYLIMWFVLTFTYIVLPNTKVKFGSAFLAGVVAGTLLQVVQWLYIDLQLGITRLSAIYGSFAAFPLFIIWIQTSWLIVLLGAEISFARQNVLRYEFDTDVHNISNYHKRILTLLVLKGLVDDFVKGSPPASTEAIAARHKIPVRVTSSIIHNLSRAGLVSQIMADQNKQRTYQPGVDINKLSVNYVTERLDKMGSDHITVESSESLGKIEEIASDITGGQMKRGEVLLKDI